MLVGTRVRGALSDGAYEDSAATGVRQTARLRGLCRGHEAPRSRSVGAELQTAGAGADTSGDTATPDLSPVGLESTERNAL